MQFTYDGKTYEYSITRKRMKNIIAHVRQDGTVWVSAPYHAPAAIIQAFVQENAGQLAGQVARTEQRREAAPDYTDGSAFPYLGEQLTLRYSPVPCRTTLENGELTVFARDPQEAELACRRWLIDACVELYRKINREVSAHYVKMGYTVPLARIEIKEMKSRWGSCTAKTGRISMNFRLMQYPPGCIYGVFYHEYAHFMHLDHSPAFYAVLRKMYPEYDRYDAILNHKQKG